MPRNRRTIAARPVMITGAASGIGRSLAQHLSRSGSPVAIADVDETGLKQTAVFNNAGVGVASSVLDSVPTDDEWLRQINFDGVVNGTRAFLPILVAQDEGVIVNTSSVFGLVGMPYQSAYCASKFAVRGFTDALRQELRGTGVSAVTVHPGGITTNIARNARVRKDPEGRGRSHEQLAAEFEAMTKTSPDKAAEIIVRGVERGKSRILVGPDAYLFDALAAVRRRRRAPHPGRVPAQDVFTSSFLLMCSGYYRYDEGYTPEFAGVDRFQGRLVHPQHWPDDLDYAGKRVVVVGSGATAVTLVPAMAEQAQHVTMLQRSPSYILSLPGEDVLANKLRRLLGSRRAYAITRWKNVLISAFIYRLSRRRPGTVRNLLRKLTVKQLPAGYDVDTHFKPSYNPWDQRLCLVPDGDLFRVIRDGQASIVTDRIDTFTERGLRLASGAELEADVVVTATGLQLLAFGGAQLVVDGRAIALPETMAYKGMMLSGIPNFAFTIGYTNASWTLKADLVSEFVCRLLAHMDANRFDQCVPVNDDPRVTEAPLLDFSAGYVLRSIDAFPRAGSRAPWRLGMSYAHDVVTLRHGRIDDGTMRFTRRAEVDDGTLAQTA